MQGIAAVDLQVHALLVVFNTVSSCENFGIWQKYDIIMRRPEPLISKISVKKKSAEYW